MEGLRYDGAPVDQLQHALQCGWLAQSQGGDDAFVIACLLHDVARAPAVAGMPYDGPSRHHGAESARWLEPRVGARVAWLAEQHVPAKRYLVATDPEYRARLSEVSERTLQEQGGPMNAAEIGESFCRTPDWEQAVSLRRIDDRGKVVGLRVPELQSYRDRLLRVVGAAGAVGTAST